LMSLSRDQFSKNQGPEGYRKPQPKAKVHRYRKGVGPEHEEPEDDDNDDIYQNQISHYTAESDKYSVTESGFTEKADEEELSARIRNRRRVRPTVVVEENEANQEETSQEQNEPAPARHATKEKVHAIEEEDDLEDVARRRAKARERLLEQERIEEENPEQGMMEEEEEEIEEEEETEEEGAGGIVSMLKPVFVSKRDRDTNEKKMEEEEALVEEQNKIKERKMLETKMLLIEAVKKFYYFSALTKFRIKQVMRLKKTRTIYLMVKCQMMMMILMKLTKPMNLRNGEFENFEELKKKRREE